MMYFFSKLSPANPFVGKIPHRRNFSMPKYPTVKCLAPVLGIGSGIGIGIDFGSGIDISCNTFLIQYWYWFLQYFCV